MKMRYFANKHGHPVFKGSVTATFRTREQAEKFMSQNVVKYNAYPLARQWWWVSSFDTISFSSFTLLFIIYSADWEVEKAAENEELEALEVIQIIINIDNMFKSHNMWSGLS